MPSTRVEEERGRVSFSAASFFTQNFPNQNASEKRDPGVYLGDAFAPRAGDAGACSSTTSV